MRYESLMFFTSLYPDCDPCFVTAATGQNNSVEAREALISLVLVFARFIVSAPIRSRNENTRHDTVANGEM